MKKKNKSIVPLISLGIIILITVLKNPISEQLRSMGLSYTMSHFTPYFLVVFFAFAISLPLLKDKSRIIRLLVRTPIALVLIAIFILQYPIFQADLFSSSTELSETEVKPEYKNFTGVVMLALPGCGHCEEAMPDYGKFQTDNPNLDARFFLMSKRPENLEFYMNEFPELKNGSLPSNVNQKYLWKQTIGVFPSYIEFKNGLPVQTWTANEFGVRAKDEILK